MFEIESDQILILLVFMITEGQKFNDSRNETRIIIVKLLLIVMVYKIYYDISTMLQLWILNR